VLQRGGDRRGRERRNRPVVSRNRRWPFPSVLWALVPLLTFGWGIGFSFTYAAIRLRDRALGLWAAAYFVLGLTSFTLVNAGDSQSDWRGYVGALLAIALIALGSAHAFGVRRSLIAPGNRRRRRRPKIVSQQEQALAEARTEMERRHEARQILTADPELARQLCIGRPDLPRRYKDGGLVDANHAPATVLAALPGFSAALADQVVACRGSVGGFRGLSDMSITLGVTPQTLDEAAAFLVFPRPGATDQS
jgi:hypothetical protein